MHHVHHTPRQTHLYAVQMLHMQARTTHAKHMRTHTHVARWRQNFTADMVANLLIITSSRHVNIAINNLKLNYPLAEQ